MTFDEICNEIMEGTLTLSATEVANIAVLATTKDDVINCDVLQEIITGLQGVKKTAREEYKEMKKELDNEQKEILATRARAYVASLNVGDRISWKKADGKIATGTLGVQKPGSKTAHVLLDEIPADSTAKNPKADRYAKFHTIIVPDEFEVKVEDAA